MKSILVKAKYTRYYEKSVEITDKQYHKLVDGEIDLNDIAALDFDNLEDECAQSGEKEFDFAVVGEDGYIVPWENEVIGLTDLLEE